MLSAWSFWAEGLVNLWALVGLDWWPPVGFETSIPSFCLPKFPLYWKQFYFRPKKVLPMKHEESDRSNCSSGLKSNQVRPSARRNCEFGSATAALHGRPFRGRANNHIYECDSVIFWSFDLVFNRVSEKKTLECLTTYWFLEILEDVFATPNLWNLLNSSIPPNSMCGGNPN